MTLTDYIARRNTPAAAAAHTAPAPAPLEGDAAVMTAWNMTASQWAAMDDAGRAKCRWNILKAPNYAAAING